MKYKALTIAGFDGSGGAGMQADLKVFTALNCYGMSVLTALPIQNTQGVKKCYDLPLSSIQEQLEAIFEDIQPDAIKIGMLFNSEIIQIINNYLKNHAQNIPIVVDPVMVAKSGHHLLLSEAVQDLKEKILPLATVITPNAPEAKVLLGYDMQETISQEVLAQELSKLGYRSVLVKGGHYESKACIDILITQDKSLYDFEMPRIQTNNTHGTGCTLSAAITANLAKGMDLKQACQAAKEYLQKALIAGDFYNLGNGYGPLHHTYFMEENGFLSEKLK